MSCIAKIDPTAIVSRQSLELLIKTIDKINPNFVFVTISQNAKKNMHTILQAAKIGDSSCYTLLRNVVLDYKHIFCDVEDINDSIEGFYQDCEALIKFVELSGEFTDNLVLILREYFSRFTFTLFNKYTHGRLNFVQYYTKNSDSTTPYTLTKVVVMKYKKHIHNIDPKYTSNAQIVKNISYQDILEAPSLNFNGLDKNELLALKKKDAVIEVVDIDGSEVETTISTKKSELNHVKIATCTEGVVIVTMSHAQSKDLLGNTSDVMAFCFKSDIDVFLVSQSSSQNSISFAVKRYHLEKINSYINARFNKEIDGGSVALNILHDQSVISVIGKGMIGKTGTAGNLFNHLGSRGVNIHAIAQNASEINISFAVEDSKTDYVMHEINKMCFVKKDHVSLCLFGYGNVGKGFVEMLKRQMNYLNEQNISVSLNFVANSKKFVLCKNVQTVEEIVSHFKNNGEEYTSIDSLISAIEENDITHPIIIDVTSSDELANKYTKFIEKGMHIVSASKKANSLDLLHYNKIHSLCKKNYVHFLYEANVGAALPVVATVQDMLYTGDKINKIEGIFSGTLSYIFNQYNNSKPFSAIVRQAKEEGFTEPDPREDLCGMDAARKILILARMLGHEMNIVDIDVQSLVPKELNGGKFTEDFYANYKNQDEEISKMYEDAKAEGRVLRYVCTLQNGKASAKIVAVVKDSPLGNVSETDNIISFSTEYYNKTPITIQGPGAGIEVTAMAVFSDVMKIYKYIHS